MVRKDNTMAEKSMSDDIISELTKGVLSYFRTKDKKKTNPRKSITKKQKAALADDGGYAKLQKAKKDAAKKKKMSMPKKRPSKITAISIIKKDTNIKTDKKPKNKKKKKIIVTKEQLRKSGLTLRDYMNMLQGKTRRDYKDVIKAAQKKRAKRSST